MIDKLPEQTQRLHTTKTPEAFRATTFSLGRFWNALYWASFFWVLATGWFFPVTWRFLIKKLRETCCKIVYPLGDLWETFYWILFAWVMATSWLFSTSKIKGSNIGAFFLAKSHRLQGLRVWLAEHGFISIKQYDRPLDDAEIRWLFERDPALEQNNQPTSKDSLLSSH